MSGPTGEIHRFPGEDNLELWVSKAPNSGRVILGIHDVRTGLSIGLPDNQTLKVLDLLSQFYVNGAPA